MGRPLKTRTKSLQAPFTYLGQVILILRVSRRRHATKTQPQFVSKRKEAENRRGVFVTGRPIGPVKLQGRSDGWYIEGLNGAEA